VSPFERDGKAMLDVGGRMRINVLEALSKEGK
jgi:hypothetical protein